MAQVNPLTRELLVKLVYYGPGLGGKTTSLQRIHQSSPPETRGQIVSLATPVDRTLYFDFLPLRAQSMRGHHVRLQLFTVPGQVYFNATRKLVLKGADGIVFVADSQRERHDANLESLENLASNLEDQGRSLAEVPLVFQYNKKDLPTAMSQAEMDESLNALGVPSFGTNAATGEGVLDALDALVRAVLDDLEAKNALGAPPVPLPEPRFARAEAALEEQIGKASEQIARAGSESTRVHVAPPPDLRDPSPVPPPPPLPMDPHVPSRDTLRPTIAPLPGEGRGLARPGPSFVALFPGDEEDVSALEREMADGHLADAIVRCDVIAQRLLAHVAQQAGLAEDTQPALVLPLLGVEGARWFSFRRLIRRARGLGPLTERDALEAYAFVIEVRVRRERLLG